MYVYGGNNISLFIVSLTSDKVLRVSGEPRARRTKLRAEKSRVVDMYEEAGRRSLHGWRLRTAGKEKKLVSRVSESSPEEKCR
jgi:hypothetical protein